MGKSTELGMSIVHRKQRLFLSVYVDDGIKIAGKKQNMAPMWKTLMKNVDLDEPTAYPDHCNANVAGSVEVSRHHRKRQQHGPGVKL